MKCHRNGFADCMKDQCALWMCFSEACGDHVLAELAQDTLADRFEAEQQRLQAAGKGRCFDPKTGQWVRGDSLKIKSSDVHRVGLSYE